VADWRSKNGGLHVHRDLMASSRWVDIPILQFRSELRFRRHRQRIGPSRRTSSETACHARPKPRTAFSGPCMLTGYLSRPIPFGWAGAPAGGGGNRPARLGSGPQAATNVLQAEWARARPWCVPARCCSRAAPRCWLANALLQPLTDQRQQRMWDGRSGPGALAATSGRAGWGARAAKAWATGLGMCSAGAAVGRRLGLCLAP